MTIVAICEGHKWRACAGARQRMPPSVYVHGSINNNKDGKERMCSAACATYVCIAGKDTTATSRLSTTASSTASQPPIRVQVGVGGRCRPLAPRRCLTPCPSANQPNRRALSTACRLSTPFAPAGSLNSRPPVLESCPVWQGGHVRPGAAPSRRRAHMCALPPSVPSPPAATANHLDRPSSSSSSGLLPSPWSSQVCRLPQSVHQ